MTEQLTSKNHLTVVTARNEATWLVQLLKFFPDYWPLPEIRNDLEHAGGETLDVEWCAGRGRQIVVWMSGGHVSWAGMFDGKTSHGRCEEPEKMPPECYALAQKVVGAMLCPTT